MITARLYYVPDIAFDVCRNVAQYGSTGQPIVKELSVNFARANRGRGKKLLAQVCLIKGKNVHCCSEALRQTLEDIAVPPHRCHNELRLERNLGDPRDRRGAIAITASCRKNIYA